MWFGPIIVGESETKVKRMEKEIDVQNKLRKTSTRR